MSIVPLLLLGSIVLAVLLLCVIGMAVGVMAGRKPIKHCGSSVGPNGETISCPTCGNRSCANNPKGEAASAAKPD